MQAQAQAREYICTAVQSSTGGESQSVHLACLYAPTQRSHLHASLPPHTGHTLPPHSPSPFISFSASVRLFAPPMTSPCVWLWNFIRSRATP